MIPNRNKLYVFLSIASATGYLWLFINLLLIDKHAYNVCLFKKITHLPCPSCGSTRSVAELLHGNITNAILINPLGLIIVILLTVVPLWLVFDLVTRKKTLAEFYYHCENIIRKPLVAIPLIVLILMNWIWNIAKGL